MTSGIWQPIKTNRVVRVSISAKRQSFSMIFVQSLGCEGQSVDAKYTADAGALIGFLPTYQAFSARQIR